MAIELPWGLRANCRTDEQIQWLARLAETIGNLQRQWSLTLGPPFTGEGSCAWVAPVRLAGATPAVLKLSMPHMEADHELDGLRFWNGEPTVRLLRSDEEAGAMLLEPCEPGTSLRELPEPDQDEVICRLLRRLWRPPSAPHPFRHLSVLMTFWSQETQAQEAQWPDAGLVREGLRLFQQLPCNAQTEVLLATDLHAGNVLKSQRQPWLVIDPKPFIGDPAYDLTQHLFNCPGRLTTAPNDVIRRVAGLAEVDYERLRLWTFARAAAEPRDDWSASGFLTRVARAMA